MRQGGGCFSKKKYGAENFFLCMASAFLWSTVNSAMDSLLYSTVYIAMVSTVQVN